jgi:hypothetical protein
MVEKVGMSEKRVLEISGHKMDRWMKAQRSGFELRQVGLRHLQRTSRRYLG